MYACLNVFVISVCVCVYVKLGKGLKGDHLFCFTRGDSSCSLWFFLCSFDRESSALEESLWQPGA